jgi:segregation and condensation protein A
LDTAAEPAPEEEPTVEPEAAVESVPEPILAPVVDSVSPIAEPPAEPITEITEAPEPPAAPAIAEELAAVEPTPAESAPNAEAVLEPEIDSAEPVADETELVSAPEPAPEEELAAKQEKVVESDPEPAPEVAEELAAVEPAPADPVPSAEPVPEAVVDAVEPVPVAVPEPPTAPDLASAPDPQPEPKLPIKTRDDAADLSPFSVIVSQVYDGPLDLLLDLIRKQDIDIYDIPIARITSQFLAYVNQLKATDVDVAGEFIYIASLLIHIKSKMLLPRAAAGPDDAAEDPRRELVERLLEHERFKNAAQMLQQKQMLEAASWTNPGIREFKNDAAAEPEIAADTVDLVRVFRDILERARRRPVFNVDEDAVTVGQMMQFLARRLTMEDKPVALRRLLSHTRSERALVAMFLALLELVRLQAVLLRQDKAFSEIFIKKHTAFDAVMNEGLANAPSDEWR